MCGIGGILRVWPAGTTPPPPHDSIPEAWLDTIDAAIKHRGPDGMGRFRDRAVRGDGSVVDVALVHRRLAIIDPACGQQPMVSERGRTDAEGRVAVVFNGCIYNHRELRRELEGAGHRFVTDHSDTEVLIHGWREWGLGQLVYGNLLDIRRGGLAGRLEGMFAAAIWDRGEGVLTLLRDQFGEKPLYTTPWFDLSQRCFAFASTPRALARLGPEFPRSRIHLESWLRFGFDYAGEVRPCSTTQLGVHDPDAVRIDAQFEPHGSIPMNATGTEGGFVRSQRLGEERVEALLAQAVERRLIADVPLGCFLSGGVDSSLVALHARRALGRLSTFTVRMPDPAYDESAHAAAAAHIIGTQHETLDCDAKPAQDLIALIEQLGLPFGDSSLLPTYWVSRAARQHVKVVLTGDGGDELFAGYERQSAAKLLAIFRPLLAVLPAGLIDHHNPKSRRARLSRLIMAARWQGYPDLASILSEPQLRRLTGRTSTRRYHRELSSLANDPADRHTASALAWDLHEYLPNDLMRKADTATMSVALEARAPFLDRDLAAAAQSATVASLMPHGQRKGLLRAVARKYLPAELVDRPKQGFAIPIGEWFRSDYGQMKTLLLDHLNAADPWPGIGIELNRTFVAQMVDEHMGHQRDHSQRLYMLLVLSIWARAKG